MVQNDPTQCRPYEGVARQLQVAPYHVAIKDFRNPPQVVDIDLLDVTSGLWVYDQEEVVAAGQLIAVQATAFDRPQHTGTKKVLWQAGPSN